MADELIKPKQVMADKKKAFSPRFQEEQEPNLPVGDWKWVAIRHQVWLSNYGSNEVTVIDGKSEFHLGARLSLEWIQKYYTLTPKKS